MNLFKKTLLFFFIWIVIFLFIFTIFEIGLRIIKLNDPWEKTLEFNLLRNVDYKIRLNNLYPSKKEFIKYTRNYYGLRDYCLKVDRIKILTMGGSTTDQRYIDNKDTFQSVLQEKISNYLKKDICISNAGLDGHSTYGHIETFKYWFPLIPNLKPTYIFLYIGLNDADFNRINPNFGYDKLNNHSLKNFLKDLHLSRRLINLYKNILSINNPKYASHKKKKYEDIDYSVIYLNKDTLEKSDLNAKEFRKRLNSILISINNMGSIPICISQPHNFVKKIDGVEKGVPNIMGWGISGLDLEYSLKQLNLQMKKLCGLDKFIDLHGVTFEDNYFYDGVHTTDLGSEYLANEIFKYMIKLNLLNRLK